MRYRSASRNSASRRSSEGERVNRWKGDRVKSAVLLLSWLICIAASRAIANELDLSPIESVPEPLGELHPDVRWMREEKIRFIWITDNLDEPFGDEGNKTKGQAIVDAGFNIVQIGMTVNSDNRRENIAIDRRPVPLEHDRSRSTDLESGRLQRNVEVGRRLGLKVLLGWKYGTHHMEPYRKYRSPSGELAKWTCCPLDEGYIADQHVGAWAVAAAEAGADGINIDVEMYHSDKSNYDGPCFCDDCFATYLAAFAADPQGVHDQVPAAGRGRWLAERQQSHGPLEVSHYSSFAARRTELLWDGIRRRCQAVNPAFILAKYNTMTSIPGMSRGLGTPSVPSLILSAHEYNHGPYRWSYMSTKNCREGLPVLFVPGLFVAKQPPQMLADNVLMSSLYCDGYYVYYGTALLTDTERRRASGGYGRYDDTSAVDYLDLLATTHARIDQLLEASRETWPPRVDGKLLWLQDKLATVRSEAERADTEEARKAVVNAEQELERYKGYMANDPDY